VGDSQRPPLCDSAKIGSADVSGYQPPFRRIRGAVPEFLRHTHIQVHRNVYIPVSYGCEWAQANDRQGSPQATSAYHGKAVLESSG